MRRIKSLGLGALMALALLAVPAGASATGGIEAEKHSIALKSNHAQMWWSKTSCGGPLATSTVAGPMTSTAPLGVPTNCSQVTANNCKIEYWLGSESAIGIGPAGCGAMKYKGSSCNWLIEPQKVPAGGGGSNFGSGDEESIYVNVSATLILTLENSGSCGEKGAKSSIWLSSEFELNGYNGYNPSQQIGIRAVDAFPQGVYVFGEGSQPQFFAEHFPGTISANSDQFKFVSAGGFEMSCGKGSVAEVELSGAAQDLELTPSYKNCTGSFGSKVTVDMNSCHYGLDLDNSGAPYSGDLDIACASEGDKVELYVDIPVVPDCVFVLSPPSRGVDYSNLDGETTSVGVSIDTASVPYVRKGASICGSNSTGTLSEGMTLVGVPW